MDTKIVSLSIVLGIVLSGPLCSAAAAPWLDAVVFFDRPSGSSDLGGPATDALGPRDHTFVSIGVPETLVLAFTDNSVGNGPGNDLAIYERNDCTSVVDVYASEDNAAYTHLGTIQGSAEFDLADYPTLRYVNYVKFVGLEDDGDHPGHDLDAAEALHSLVRLGPDNDTPVPGAALLSLIGTGSVTWLRRRRTL